MNKKLSLVAFGFFALAWAFGLAGYANTQAITNAGLMWITLAAIVGRENA